MSAALLDVNVLVALAWPNHVHHGRAREWFRARGGRGWATCPATQVGFVRVSSHPVLGPEARRPLEAIDLLTRLVALAGHEFWHDDIEIVHLDWLRQAPLASHRQLPDLHLVAVALAHGGRLATLDRKLPAALPEFLDASTTVELVPD